MHHLHRMNSCNGKSGRLLEAVVNLVEVFVEEGGVIETVIPVGGVVLEQ